MERIIIPTSDGSNTIYLPQWNESYHSRHGAIQEAYHVFLKNGLFLFQNTHLNILEIGFGTGLNTLLTYHEHTKYNLRIHYTALEAYPITNTEIQQMQYAKALKNNDLQPIYEKIHQSQWEKEVAISAHFTLLKRKLFFQEIQDKAQYNLIYFDAFGARVQPELWTETIFNKMYQALTCRGILVTYASKGSVRRAMLSTGFEVEKLPGPPGKREMLRAVKP